MPKSKSPRPFTIRCVLMQPGGKPMPIEIVATLPNYQACVGGYIERLSFPENEEVDLLINEEGRLFHLPATLNDPRHEEPILGSVLAVRRDGADWDSLTPEQVEEVSRWMEAVKVRSDRLD